MSDIFYDYMSKRLGDLELNNLKTKPGPVVTISRLAGCSSMQLAYDLAEKLNEIGSAKNWTVISKDILREAAEQLQLNPKKIKNVFKIHERTVLEEIMNAFLSKDYQLERKMRNTVINVIRRFSIEGHKIILGRGGSQICADIENALHVRIVAPLDWRIKKVMKTKNFTKEEALHCIENTEKNRSSFRQSIKGKSIESDNFDLIINQSSYTNDEIIKIIVEALKIKKII